MAAQMQNTGQIYALYNSDAVRFRPIFERLKRAGAKRADTAAGRQVRACALEGRMDLALIDAPCSGTGVWRRRPDAKWRLTSAQLAERTETQSALLERAARLLKPQGTLAYVTCSILPHENDKQIKAFLEHNPSFSVIDAKQRAAKVLSQSVTRSDNHNKLWLL